MKRLLFCLLCLLALLVAACVDPIASTVPRPTPTLISTVVAPINREGSAGEGSESAEIVAAIDIVANGIVDRELLGAAGVQAACDAPPEAAFVCDNPTNAPRFDVQIGASTFARWSLRWEDAAPLSGDEVLALRLTSSGKLTPNVYLVSDNSRIAVPLSQFGLAAGNHTIHLPLREVRDNQGNTPDLTTIHGLELVFEWADMQGTLQLESVRIESVWRETLTVGDASYQLAAALQVPDGFQARAVADGLPQMTQIDFTPAGEMFVSLQGGRVWRFADTNGDTFYDERMLYTTGMTDLVGLLYDPTDGGVWLGSRGNLLHTLDSDGNGVADTHTPRVEGLAWGRHQNNGLVWNPDPDPFTGEPGGTWLYFGLGSTDDLEVGGELNATVLRFPRTGQGMDSLEVVSHGNRNAYDVAWAALPLDLDQPDGPRDWQLFASENGPDFNDAPDEVNHIRWGHHYGFPEHFGAVGEGEIEGDPYSGPVYEVTPHASADGLAYVDNPAWPVDYRTLYVSLFGEVFNPVPVGHIVERITLHSERTPSGELTYRGEPSPFVVGLDRPLPLAIAPNGNLLVGDYATGVIYEIHYLGQ